MIDLILYKTYADLRAEAAKTYINYLWWVIDPILSMLVFYLVFGLIFQRGGEGFVPFLLVGLVIWNWYKQTLSHAGNSILAGKGLMNQVHVPKLVFPTVTLLTDLTKFGFVFVLLLIFLWLSGDGIGRAYLALPLVLAVQLLFSVALAFLLAAVVPYLPDLKFLVENLLQLQFFASGVFFSTDDISERYQFWFYLNPMASLIHDYRNILLHNEWPAWGRLSFIALLSLALLTLVVKLIQRHDRDYPRVVR
ncbi:ABC transporter permease [Thiocystis minor]|uniref:ABC transporter permease n=1 Tax=Thiocystis minor TaxID=61597 RepID=UPI0019140774|nr:ABC transporter permease [Thiocystis minor]